MNKQGWRTFLTESVLPRAVALTPDSIARGIAYAVDQPSDVDVNEIIIRPTAGGQ